MRASVLAAAAAVVLAAGAAHAQVVHTDIPDSLAHRATISEAAARATALARVPHGTVAAVELEHERGHLQYSYDVTVPGRRGITEVNVDARTGKVLGVHHESAADEAREAGQEKPPHT